MRGGVAFNREANYNKLTVEATRMKRILVTGAGGFIGHHLVTALKRQGHWVRGADLKHPEYTATDADEFEILDLRRIIGGHTGPWPARPSPGSRPSYQLQHQLVRLCLI